MTFKAPGRLSVPQWGVVNRLLTAENVTFDQYGKEVAGSRTRTDLTGGIVYFTVRDDDGNIVIQKDSTDAAEIELKNQVAEATKGQAVVHFVYDDTAPLITDLGQKYWFDAWALLPSGLKEPIVDRGRFFVEKSVTHIDAGPAPSLPTYPAPQVTQERSFNWSAPSAVTTYTITVPDDGMVDAVYGVWATFENVVGSTPTSYKVPSSTRTATQFDIEFDTALAIGDTVNFFLRDM